VDFCDELNEEVYVLELKNIPRTDSDRLADMVRDTKAEIKQLKAENDGLKQKLQTVEEKVQIGGRDEKKRPDIAAWTCTQAADTNTFLNWTARINSAEGTYTTQENQIRFTKAGLYRIIVRTSFTISSGDGYTDLYLNGSIVSRFYQSSNTGYVHTSAINEILEIANNNYIQVYVYHNGTLLTDLYDNSLTIERLGS